MGHNKDILWKGLLEWVFGDLLRFLFPDADQVFDLRAPLDFMDKELAGLCPEPKAVATRIVDKLVKVKLKVDGFAMVHIEVQGQTRTDERLRFDERMFRYFNLIFSKYQYPLAAIAIFTGEDGHLMSDRYRYVFMNTRLAYQYNTINIREYSDEELAGSENPFAWALLVAKQALWRGKDRDQRLFDAKWLVFNKFYRQGQLEDRKMQAVLLFLQHYVHFEDPEKERKFRVQVDQLTGKTNTMDIFQQVAEIELEEAREKGEQRAKQKIVRNLLQNSEFSDEKIASTAEVSVELVIAIREQLRAK